MRLIFYLRPEEDLGPMPQEKVRPKLLEHRVALGPTFSRCPPLIPLSTFAYSELGLIVIKQFWLQCIQSEMKGGGGIIAWNRICRAGYRYGCGSLSCEGYRFGGCHLVPLFRTRAMWPDLIGYPRSPSAHRRFAITRSSSSLTDKRSR